MKCIEWVNSRIKKMKWFDISFVKLSVAAFILMIAKLWSPILALDWYWYMLIGILMMIRPLYMLFKR